MTSQLYRQQIIDHYKNPHNIGKIENADFSAKFSNLSCGDEIEVFLKVKNKMLIDVNYIPNGCAISVASASLVTDEVIGMSISEILQLDENFVQKLLGTKLTSSRIKCAMLILEAIKKAIKGSKV